MAKRKAADGVWFRGFAEFGGDGGPELDRGNDEHGDFSCLSVYPTADAAADRAGGLEWVAEVEVRVVRRARLTWVDEKPSEE